MYSIIFLAVSSFVFCLILTPLVRRWSQRVGVLDLPNAVRKLHASPIPHTGGVAIGGAYLLALALLIASPLAGSYRVNLPIILHLLPAAGVVFATGLIDDVMGLNPWEKLFGQVGAAGLAYWGGVHVLGFGSFSPMGWWTLPLTIFWLVGCANAFNLIDGVDGLATGIGLFAAFTMLAAALLQNNAPLAMAMAPLVGALLAFLRYNFNPASIFLGDSGSLTIGFLLGCAGAIWSQKSATVLGMTAPLMALSVPLLDTALAIVRRFLRHQPIFGGDRNHIHHRLLDRGFSPRVVVLMLYGFCGIAAAFSLLQTSTSDKFAVVLLVLFCGAAWIGIQFLGYIEFDAARRVVLGGAFRRVLSAQISISAYEQKMKQARTPGEYWEVIRDASREMGFSETHMELDGVSYQDHGTGDDPGQCATITIPLAGNSDGLVSFSYRLSPNLHRALAMTTLVEIMREQLETAHRSATIPGLAESDAARSAKGAS